MNKETRHSKFRRLAEKRTISIIKHIRLLGNCANKSYYEYSKEEVEKIFNAISSELREAKSKYTFNKRNEKEKIFEL